MPDSDRGRRTILTLVGGGVASMLLGIALSAWRTGPHHVLQALVDPITLAALGALTYRGTHWARGAVIVWLGLTAAVCGIGGVIFLVHAPLPALISLLLAGGFGYSAIELYTSEDVEAVVDPDQFTKRTPPPRVRT